MDTTTAIDTATSPEVFDVLSFIEGSAYPTETVVVFTNAAAAEKYIKLVNERLENDKNGDSEGKDDEKAAKLSEEIELVGDQVRKSSLVFELQGMAPGVVQELIKAPEGEVTTPELEMARDNVLIARTIKTVRNADGKVDPRTWHADDVAKLRTFLKEGEFGKLVGAVGSVNFNAAVFDQATDAGFSRGSADVA